MPGRQAWDEIWPIIGPQIEIVMKGEGATWHENQLIPILRRGSLEDVYWTYSYGPIDDPAAEHGVGGVLVICTETTQQVLVEQQLHRSDRLKDRFLATLSHELRNPLAPILTASNLLTRPEVSSAQILECGRLIHRQSHIMGLLLDDLLELSRITSGKLELRRSRVDAKAIVDAAVEAVRPAIDAKAHALTVTMPDERVSFVADPLRLSQVLINLLANAAKYTDPDGQIALVVRRSDSHVWFEVSDNGIGLAPEMRPDLFEIFHQAKDTLDRSQGGLGIGPRAVEGPGRAARRTHRGRERGHRARIDVSRGDPVRRDVAGCPGGERCRDACHATAGATAPRARRRRQPRHHEHDGNGAGDRRVRIRAGSRRCRGARGGRGVPAAGRVRRHRHAAHGRLPGRRAASRHRLGRDMLLIATTGWGSAGGQAARARCGLRPAPDQARVAGRARQPARGPDGSVRTVMRRAARSARRID
jgi:hypothetical protein